MKLSLAWLKDYVALPDDLKMEDLAHDLTMRTVEVEGYENPKDMIEGIKAGRILSVEAHPDADLLRVCRVDVGADEPLQIVCGGSNLYEGEMVAVAVPGSYVRWHGEGEPVKIRKTKLRGVKSEGMICGSNELGLEQLLPAADDHEIVDLKDFTAQAGDDLADVLGLDDWILEIDNKSMTNRPDLWGHYGMARELAAIYGLELKPMPEFKLPEEVKPYPVRIEAEECMRYVGAVYEGLEVKASPFKMQRRLWSVGLRPINNLVDITNYVMLSTGQPTHGFDFDHVPGGIVVRRARENDNLELLDETVLELTENDLLITDGGQALALAGVMGGKKDSILPETHKMILEVASFNAMSIRRTTQRHNVRTESSTRFEKNIDTARVDQTLALADQLIREILPEAKLQAFGSAETAHTEPSVVELDLDFLKTRIGREISGEEVRRYLSPLGFEVTEEDEKKLSVKAPVWRSTGDISLPDDLLEEVARMIGYENFEFIPPTVKLEGFVKQETIELQRRLCEFLAFRCGFQEVYSYPWVNEQYIKASGLDHEDWVELEAPPSPEEKLLRGNLVPNLLELSADNLRYFDEFRIFEMAQVFRKGAYSPSEEAEVLPLMERELGLALVGKDAFTLFREAKGTIESLPRLCHTEPLGFSHEEKPSWADPKMWLNITDKEGSRIGDMGLISLSAEHEAGIKHAMVFLVRLNVEKLVPLPSRENHYEPLPLYPEVWQDLNVVVPKETAWASIAEALAPHVKRSRFIEEYKGRQLPEGMKSVIFRYWLGKKEGTLTADEIEEANQRILKTLEKKVAAKLRT